MQKFGGFNGRRPVTLLVAAALLVVVGLVSAIGAPAGPPQSNKAQTYGGPLPTAPKNPQNRAQCDKYYGASNTLPEARDCRALAARNVAMKKCGKKKTRAEKSRCKKAAKKKYARERAAIVRQRAAQKKCQDKHSSDLAALDPNADDYMQRSQAADDEYNRCMKAASGG